jgi:hypothetical protein
LSSKLVFNAICCFRQKLRQAKITGFVRIAAAQNLIKHRTATLQKQANQRRTYLGQT